MLCCVVLWCGVVCCTRQLEYFRAGVHWSVVLCCVVLCCGVVSCVVVLCCVVLCCVVLECLSA